MILGHKAFGQSPAAAAVAKPGITSFTPVRGGVGAFTGRGGTIGYLEAKDALVAVDCQFPDTALIAKQGLAKDPKRMIDVTFNTHHHLDHTSGNVVFKPASNLLVAQTLVPKLQFEAAQRAESSGKASDYAMLNHQVYADTLFDSSWTKEVGGETVTADSRGANHSGSDSTIYFEKANVVHTGDLVFNRLYPVIDKASGASIKSWIKTLGDVMAAYPADAKYIFGHGNPAFGVIGAKADVLKMQEFLNGLMDYTQKQIDAGKDKSTVIALDNLPGFNDWHLPLPNRLGSCLGAAYDELTSKNS